MAFGKKMSDTDIYIYTFNVCVYVYIYVKYFVKYIIFVIQQSEVWRQIQ